MRANSDQFSECSGVVIPNEEFEKTAEIALTSSLSTIDEKGKILISTINISDHYVHIKADTLIASFEILNQSQADRLINIDPQLIALAKIRDPNDLETGLNQLVLVDLSNQKTRLSPEYNKLWFPTPKTCSNPEILPPLHREIYEQIKHFQSLAKNDPKNDCDQKEKFLQNFKWENSVLTPEQKVEVEKLLVEFSDIFLSTVSM